MLIYLDESGDLGWNFNSPYRRGGSSRYLTLAFLFVEEADRHRPQRVMKSMYKLCHWEGEKKACDATYSQKQRFSNSVVALLNRCRSIKIDVITVKKTNVKEYIRNDANKLYNYMAGLVIPDYVSEADKIKFIPDERTVKTKSGNSLADYLQIKLWFDHQYPGVIENLPSVSHKNYNLQFVDWLAHCIWINYENDEKSPFKVLRSHINLRCLFFNHAHH